MKLDRIGSLQEKRVKKTFRQTLYDSATGEYFGRTCLSWIQITIFYLTFYSCLITLFSGLLIIFLQTLSISSPYYKRADNILGTTPGVSYFPGPPKVNPDSDLIWFKPGNDGNWKYYMLEAEKCAKEYDIGADVDTYLIDCEDGKVTPSKEESCDFILDDLGDCDKNHSYGYATGQPCIFLKLNRIYGWQPQIYSIDAFPKDVPEDIRDVASKSKSTLIYVDCDGVHPEDKLNLGPVKYHPEQGFPVYYFPYLNQKDYLNPLVAVQFTNPLRDILISVRCNLWAKNIEQEVNKRIGGLRFSLIVEN